MYSEFYTYFSHYGLPIPSNAAVERLIPIGMNILSAKRSHLSDENFEMLLFMRETGVPKELCQ